MRAASTTSTREGRPRVIGAPWHTEGGGRDMIGRIEADEEWDAGDMACGELVLELRMRIGRLRAGQVLKVVARDAGAPADMPAWCGLTGHTLVSHEHPAYFIRKKED